MTLNITLFDQNTARLSGAEVKISYKLPNGKLWESGSLKANGQGVVGYEMDPDLFKYVRFKNADYWITYNGKSYRGKVTRLPNNKSRVLHLQAQGLVVSARKEPDEPKPSRQEMLNRQVLVRLTLKTGNGKALRNAPLTMVTRVKGKDIETDLGKTNGKGYLEHETLLVAALSIGQAKPRLINRATGKEFSVVDFQRESLEGDTLTEIWTLRPVAAAEIDKEDDKEETTDTPSGPTDVSGGEGPQGEVHGTLLLDDNPVKKRKFSLVWYRKNGLRMDISLPRTDQQGQFLWEGSAFLAVEAGLMGAQLYDDQSLTVYRVMKVEEKTLEEGRATFVWQIAETDEEAEERPDLEDGEQGLISGVIRAAGGQPQARMVVRAFDVDFPDEQELGSDETDDGGFYAINYAAGTSDEREKDALDIVVRVYEPGSEAKAKPLVESELTQKAPLQLAVDLVTGEYVYPGAALYDRIYADVAPTLKGASIRSLTPASVVLLAARTRFEKKHLHYFVTAWALALLAGESDTEPSSAGPFFGWLMDGMPAHPVTLALQTPENLAASLNRAIDANWIADMGIQALLERISRARAQIIAAHQPDLVAFLQAGNLTEAQAGKVIGIFLDGQDAEARDAALLQELGQTKGKRAQELIEMWRALRGKTRLGTRLLTDGGVRVPRDLVELTVNHLAKHARESGTIPEHIDGKNDTQRSKIFAAGVLREIENRYPIAYFAHQLTLMQHPPTKALGVRLKTALQMEPLRAGGADPVIIGGWDQTLTDLASLYSAAVPARRAPLVDQLIRNGYNAAPDITKDGLTNFREKMAQNFATVGEAADADRVFVRAQMIVSLANAEKMQKLTEQMPTGNIPHTLSRQLFHGTVKGDCQHCESMTSPSAYLLDLVRYVKRANGGESKTGWDRVNARRPDLKNIDLTCANSHTSMPYIDLVLELLEDQVKPWTHGPRQTIADEEILAQRPYYVNERAYAELTKRRFPWAACYNRQFDVTRRVLEQAGLSLADLKAATKGGGATARFGLWSEEVFGLVTSGADASRAMGASGMNTLKTFNTLAKLAAHLLVTPEDLLEMLGSRFVNPDGKYLVGQKGDLVWADMPAKLVGRLAFMGQMRVQTGWDIPELDAWLALVDPARADWHEQLAAGLRVAARDRLSPAEIALLIALPRVECLTELADIARVSETVMTGIDAAINEPVNSPVGIDTRLQLAETLSESGRRDADVLMALIGAPEAGGVFDPAKLPEAEAALAETYAAAFADAEGDVTAEETLVVAETLAGVLSADAATLQALLPSAGLIDALRAGNAIGSDIMRLWKEASAVTVLELEEDDVAALPGLTAKFGLLNITDLPVRADQSADFNALASLVALADMNARFYREDESLLRRLGSVTSTLASLAKALALPDLGDAALQPLLAARGMALQTPRALFEARRLRDFSTLIAACRQLSTDGATLLDIINKYESETVWGQVEAIAGPSDWARWARQISDPVRERARDALLAELIYASRSGDGPRFKTADDVYGQFLIDPQMMAVADTSRIKQASASLQQFVQRVQLGLEPSVVFSQNDAAQWAWRRNYRVWEANRKVMVFPENWIRPELRDNKTDLYKQLESDLLKNDIRAETAEEALLNFARGMHEVAGLEMIALQEDDDTGTTYIVGRTRETPHKYFFNTRGLNGLWSGWEAIDVEIEGDHILPVVFARRVFLAWVTFESKIATEDQAYLDKISILESDQSVVRDEIDAIKRKVSEIENKQEENAKYLEKTWSGPNGAIYKSVYQNIDTAYTNLLIELRGDIAGEEGGQLGELRTRERELISEVNELKQKYSYYEASLSISQRRRHGGWEPVRKSSSTIRTILETRSVWGWLAEQISGDRTVFYSRLDRFHVRVSSEGQNLTFTLCSSIDRHDDIEERREAVFGTFDLDVVNNILTATERYYSNGLYKSALLKNGHVEKQFITLRPEEGSLTVLDNGRVPLLGRVSNAAVRVVPHRYAEGTSMVFEQGRRSYLLERAAYGTSAHAAIDTQETGRQMQAVAADDSMAAPATQVAPDVPGVALAGDEGWRFTPLYHPFTDVIVTELYRYGLEGLYVPDAASGEANAGILTRQRENRENFGALFAPTPQVAEPLPAETFSFDRKNPFGVYNWELFFHGPFAVAEALRQNRRYEDARRWYHYIFNPLEKSGPTQAYVWRFRPFFREHDRILDKGTPNLMDEVDNPDFAGQVEEWEQNPFNPHAVARLRTVAYMRAVFMAYVENLIDWGDDLFRRDTMESVNEAAQLYVFALDMLGEKPVELPDIEDGKPAQSVGELLSWTASPESLRFVLDKVQPHPDNTAMGSAFFDLFGDFCTPSNDKLMALWARLADRLFKIRNSQNIDGAFRKLALFQPPIDPALLVKAAASGLSIADAVAGLSARRPNYRFTFMVAKALEFTADVRSLGASLLSALEKRDAEALSQLRASHEVSMTRQMRGVYEDRIKEVEYSITSLDAELTRLTQEELHYDTLIANGDLPEEQEEEAKVGEAHAHRMAASAYHGIAALVSAIPQFGISGISPTTQVGGLHIGSVYKAFGDVLAMASEQSSHIAGMASRTAGRIRRAQDWMRAKENAASSIKRVQQDRLAAEIRLAIAQQELDQHDQRIAQALEAETFLSDKFTNEALYSWMVDRLSGLYFQAFKLASGLAGQAQVCYRDELSDDAASFLEPGAWDSLHKGLLAGEQLTLDLRRMEASYLAKNARQHELTKSISLAQLNPAELLRLRTTGACQMVLPEALFDLDHAGHINRRIKSVNVTIPAVAGPQTSISASLTLTSSEVRRKTPDGETALHPSRAGESVATSTGQNDTGMFQFDFRDVRYLKFEGAGVVSSWDITLPDPALAQFDYGSITDLILQVHYTAEDGPENHANAVTSSLRSTLSEAGLPGRTLFSLRYDFPQSWARLKNEPDLTMVTLDFAQMRFPYLYANRQIELDHLTLTAVVGDPQEAASKAVALESAHVGNVELALSAELREALDGTARDILLVTEFTAGPV